MSTVRLRLPDSLHNSARALAGTMPFSIRSTVLVVLLLAPAAPAGETPQKGKPAEFTLVNKAKDIRVISDRDESILDYFRRNRILVGTVLPEGLKKVLEARKPLKKFFLSYASQNDDPAKASTFGASPDVAPPSAAVVKLLEKHRPDGKKKLGLTLILRRDDTKPGLYHVVGCTERTPVGFFDNGKENATDGFSQKDLRYKGEEKK
jgi:hypothetical protein